MSNTKGHLLRTPEDWITCFTSTCFNSSHSNCSNTYVYKVNLLSKYLEGHTKSVILIRDTISTDIVYMS